MTLLSPRPTPPEPFSRENVFCYRGLSPQPASNDPRLVRDSSEVFRISAALEQPLGRELSYFAASVGPMTSTILAAANRQTIAVKASAVAFILLGVNCTVVILVCGKSLLNVIDETLKKTSGKGGSGVASQELLRARKKIVFTLMFVVQSAGQTLSMLVVAVVTNYGTAVPLILFGIPMGIVPLIWHAFCIQLHQGRSKLSNATSWFHRPLKLTRPKSPIQHAPPQIQRVVPLENNAITPC